MLSLGGITDHLDFLVTVEVSKSSPGSWTRAPSLYLGRVNGFTEASVSIGQSVPVSTEVIRAGLISSSISVDVGVLGISTSMSAPSSSELVCSGVWLCDEVVVEFFLLLDFVSSNDGGDQSEF